MWISLKVWIALLAVLGVLSYWAFTALHRNPKPETTQQAAPTVLNPQATTDALRHPAQPVQPAPPQPPATPAAPAARKGTPARGAELDAQKTVEALRKRRTF